MNRDFLMGFGAGRSAGSGGGGGGTFYINATVEWDETGPTVTIDKTFEEIKAAYDAGSNLALIDNEETVYQLTCAGTENFYFSSIDASLDFVERDIRISADGADFIYTYAGGANHPGNAWWSVFCFSAVLDNGTVTWNTNLFPPTYTTDIWQGMHPVARLCKEGITGCSILNCEFMDGSGNFRFSHTYKDGNNLVYEAVWLNEDGTSGHESITIQ